MSLFSVVITIYNKENVLERCVESLLEQTYKDLEIVLVDDGSKDSSPLICQKYADNYNQVVYVRQENQGVAPARNTGLRAASGKYITFIDADDYLEKDVFEKVSAFLEQYPETDMVSWGCWEEGEQGEKLAVISMKQECFASKQEAFLDINKRILGYVWLWSFKREILLDNQILFEKYLEPIDDYYFVLQAFSCAKVVGSVENTFYHYVRSNSLESLSKRIPKHVFLQHKKICEYKIILYRELGMDSEFIEREMKIAAYAAFKNGVKQLFRADEPMKIQKIQEMLDNSLMKEYFYGCALDVKLKESERQRYEATVRKDCEEIYKLFELYEAEKQKKSEE